MTRRGHFRCSVGAVFGAGLLALAACVTDYQRGVEDPPYGTPAALPPSGGSTPGVDSGGTTPQCAPEAGAGTCAVTFRSILESFRTAQCSAASSCHGGATPPRINPDDAAATYAALTSYTIVSNGKPYVNPCSTNPADSSIICNLSATSCGVAMPQGAPGTFDPAKLSDIQTWIGCGSPNN